MLDVHEEPFDIEKIEIVVLDLDGTAVNIDDLRKPSKEISSYFVEKKGIIQPTNLGKITLSNFYRFLNEIPPNLWSELSNTLHKISLEHQWVLMGETIPPISGIHQILDYFNKNNIPHIYLTQGIYETQIHKLKQTGLLERLDCDFLASSRFAKIDKNGLISIQKEKLMPYLPQLIYQQFGISVNYDEILYIDDKPSPVLTARNLGINAFLLDGKYNDNSIQPEFFLPKLEQIIS